MKVEGNDRAFAAWEDLRRRVEALENSIPLNSRVDPPGCPACDGVAGTACRCAEPVPTADKQHCGAEELSDPESVMTLCFCGAEQIGTNTATERRGKKHTALKCGLCCTHGVFLEDRPDGKGCEQCYPKPVPEWRRLVSDQQFRIPPDHPPLATVLHCLARIERGVAGDTHVLDSRDYLARIVAVCEAQVGDGWQADPDSARLHAGVDVVTSLLNRITMWPIGSPPIIDWEDLGHGAAERLRDLTEEQS